VETTEACPPLNKKEGNWNFLSHKLDFFRCNCEFTSHNSTFFVRIARYKLVVDLLGQ